MPVRATKRGEQRTRLQRDCDVLICGASFAGLAVARELAGAGADVLVAGTAVFQSQDAFGKGPTDYAGNIARLRG